MTTDPLHERVVRLEARSDMAQRELERLGTMTNGLSETMRSIERTQLLQGQELGSLRSMLQSLMDKIAPIDKHVLQVKYGVIGMCLAYSAMNHTQIAKILSVLFGI